MRRQAVGGGGCGSGRVFVCMYVCLYACMSMCVRAQGLVVVVVVVVVVGGGGGVRVCVCVCVCVSNDALCMWVCHRSEP